MRLATLGALSMASLLAGCGGGGTPPSPPASQQADPTLIASPTAISANLLSGAPTPFSISITSSNGNLPALTLSASDLSFLTTSLQQTSSATATLNVLLVGAGTSTVSVRDNSGAHVDVPVVSEPCGRPDILTYAQLISPAHGAQNVPLNTGTFFVEVAGMPGQPTPFTPALHAHIVVNKSSTVDPQTPLTTATPPPNAVTPSPAPQRGSSIGYESGALPQLDAGSSYTIYLWSDTCEAPWNAGSFST